MYFFSFPTRILQLEHSKIIDTEKPSFAVRLSEEHFAAFGFKNILKVSK